MHGNMLSDEDEAPSAASASLKEAVRKATTPICRAGGEVEGDPVGMAEVSVFIANKPNSVADLAKYMKQRIKDSNEEISFIALHVLDECMRTFQFTFHAQVMKVLLKRLGIMAQPYSGYSSKLREKAASLLISWGERLGSDPRLEKFQIAGAQVRKRQVQEVAGAFKDDLQEREQVKRVAEEADIRDLQTAMREMGIDPAIAACALAEHNAVRAEQQRRPRSSTPPPPARALPSRPQMRAEPPAAPSAPMEEASARPGDAWLKLKPKAGEHAALLGAMMVAESQETTAIATECLLLQSRIRGLSAELVEESEIVDCVGMVEVLARALKQWEDTKSMAISSDGAVAKSNKQPMAPMPARVESENSFLGQHEAFED